MNRVTDLKLGFIRQDTKLVATIQAIIDQFGSRQSIDAATFTGEIQRVDHMRNEQFSLQPQAHRLDKVTDVDALVFQWQPHAGLQPKMSVTITIVVKDTIETFAPEHSLTWHQMHDDSAIIGMNPS